MADNILINFSRNPDLIFISNLIARTVRNTGRLHYVYTACRVEVNYKFEAEERTKLISAKSTSIWQIVNLCICAFCLLRTSSSSRLYLTSPSFCSILLVLLSRLKRIKVYAFIHDVTPHYSGLKGWLYDLQNYIIFRNSKVVFVFSEYSKSEAVSRFGHFETEVCVLPLPTPVEYFVNNKKWSKIINDFPDPIYDFVWWGRAEEYKGLYLLPKIANNLLQFGCNLLIISNLSGFKDLYKSLSVLSNVTIIDAYLPEDELICHLLQARVNLCPYISATQSGIVNYCMCLGIPSASTRVGALHEQSKYIRNGNSVDFTIESPLHFNPHVLLSNYEKLNRSDVSEYYHCKNAASNFEQVLKGFIS